MNLVNLLRLIRIILLNYLNKNICYIWNALMKTDLQLVFIYRETRMKNKIKMFLMQDFIIPCPMRSLTDGLVIPLIFKQ